MFYSKFVLTHFNQRGFGTEKYLLLIFLGVTNYLIMFFQEYHPQVFDDDVVIWYWLFLLLTFTLCVPVCLQ